MQKGGMQISSVSVLRQQGKVFLSASIQNNPRSGFREPGCRGHALELQPSAILISPASLQAPDLHLSPAG